MTLVGGWPLKGCDSKRPSDSTVSPSHLVANGAILKQHRVDSPRQTISAGMRLWVNHPMLLTPTFMAFGGGCGGLLVAASL